MADRIDPYTSFLFTVEIEGIEAGGFTEVNGLVMETGVKTFREGGVSDFEYKIPEFSKQSNLTLKKGLTDADLLWNWYKDVVNGKIERKNISVILKMHGSSDKKVRWDFKEAFPVKWEGPALNAASTNLVATQSLVIVHHGFLISFQ